MNKEAISKTEIITELSEVEITDMAVGGKGVGRIDGKVVFVENGVVGQCVSANIFKDRKDYAEARVVDVLRPSPIQREPECSHFFVCGGCSLQNINYKEQLNIKRSWVQDSLERIGEIEQCTIDDTVPSPDEYFYRNKMEYSFSDRVWDFDSKRIVNGAIDLGLHLPGRFDTIIPVKTCYLQSDASNRILRLVRKFAQKSGYPAYNIRKHTGFWRFLVIREAKSTGDMLINLLTNECSFEQRQYIDSLCQTLQKSVPEIASIYHAEHSGKSQASVWDSIRNVYGEDEIYEQIGTLKFAINCDIFFQVNPQQIENLYNIVLHACKLTGNEVVYDLYSGAGTISLFLAGHAKKIVGLELNPASVESAVANARLNNIDNCHFIQGKVRSLIKYPDQLFEQFGKPDIVIVDPPRSGLDPKSTERVAHIGASKIIYVSCNPSTLARDVKILSDCYSIDKIIPVDMFPQTAHVESVTTLLRC